MYEIELSTCLKLIKKAAEMALNVYESDNFFVEIKDDNSPVTIADKMIDSFLKSELKKAFPSYSILSEETSDDLSRLKNDYVFIIDPIDGTKNFIARDGNFSINIALVYKNNPVLGVISIPCDGTIFYAIKNQGAYKIENENIKRIHTSNKSNNLIALISVFHTNEEDKLWLEKHRDLIGEIKTSGSTKKGCLIAEGKADVSYRTTHNTKEWDTCAINVIAEEAGGVLLDLNFEKITYNKVDVYNHNGYVICNKKENLILLK